MAEEKFISIDYATWNAKYKPMEQVLQKVRQELAEEKESKVHTLYIKIDDRTVYAYERSHYRLPDFGFHFEGQDGYYGRHRGAKILTFEPVLQPSLEIDSLVLISIKGAISNYIRDNKMVTEDQFKEHSDKITKFQQEAGKKEMLLEARIQSIPKLIRWLFKIKL